MHIFCSYKSKKKLTRVARKPRDDVIEQQPGLRPALGAPPPPLDGEAERRPAAEDPCGAAGEVALGDPGAAGGEGALGAADDGAVAEVHSIGGRRLGRRRWCCCLCRRWRKGRKREAGNEGEEEERRKVRAVSVRVEKKSRRLKKTSTATAVDAFPSRRLFPPDPGAWRRRLFFPSPATLTVSLRTSP